MLCLFYQVRYKDCPADPRIVTQSSDCPDLYFVHNIYIVIVALFVYLTVHQFSYFSFDEKNCFWYEEKHVRSLLVKSSRVSVSYVILSCQWPYSSWWKVIKVRVNSPLKSFVIKDIFCLAISKKVAIPPNLGLGYFLWAVVAKSLVS